MVSFIPCVAHANTYGNTYVDSPHLKRDFCPVSNRVMKWFSHMLLFWRVTENVVHDVGILRRSDCRNLFCGLVLSTLIDHRNMKEKALTSKYLYSVAEAAALLSLSRATVYKLINSGQILAVYPTSQARVSAEALHRYVALLELSLIHI